MLFCFTKLSVKLLSELRYQDMISVQCNVNNLLPNVAFSRAILSHENCMSHSMSISHQGSGSDRTVVSERQSMALATLHIGGSVTCSQKKTQGA